MAGRTIRQDSRFAGSQLVSGKYLWYFQVATEWFMTS